MWLGLATVKPAVSPLVAWCVTVAHPAGSDPGWRLIASTICTEEAGSDPGEPPRVPVLLCPDGVPVPACPDGVPVLCPTSMTVAAPPAAPSRASSTRAIHRPLRRLRRGAGPGTGAGAGAGR